MNYSFINKAFPNYSESRNFIDYAPIDSSNNIDSITAYTDSMLTSTKPAKAQVADIIRDDKDYIVVPRKHLLENYKNTDHLSSPLKNLTNEELIKQSKFYGTTTHENPLQFYNTESDPSMKYIHPHYERFTNSDQCTPEQCDAVIQYILNCKECKQKIIKQLGIERENNHNEDLMELASYIIFGVFILLVLDSFKRK